MRTQEQIATAAMKKHVMFSIEKRENRMYDGFEVMFASAFDGYMTNSWCSFVDFENGKGLEIVWCDARTPTATERMFAERLLYQNSNLHECNWTF